MKTETKADSESKAKNPQIQNPDSKTTTPQPHNAPRSHRPHIMILATGGTIAGVAADPHSSEYQAGVLSIETLLNTLPTTSTTLTYEQLANIDSADMTDSLWLTLAKRVNALLARDDIDGIVITHGSDTMEESAFFLHLTLSSGKPVVLTGAMRPSNALNPDGIANLYNAITLASSSHAHNKGVMIVMNDTIQSARYVAKTHTHHLNALSSPNRGDMGYIANTRAHFYYTPIEPHTTQSLFCVDTLEILPKVGIVYAYDGSNVLAQALYESRAKGIIVVGSGAGNIHCALKRTLHSLIQRGVIVVASTRVGAGCAQLRTEDQKSGFISARDLNPQKARVLLALALTHTDNPAEIAQIFAQY
ncbi:asparaginase [uncultured Helicobacter sp.]|uniref:asparaginase n=1 Tax=uncultured Helicobacter sp. TaxID=175537 RepID=UPI00374ECFBA